MILHFCLTFCLFAGGPLLVEASDEVEAVEVDALDFLFPLLPLDLGSEVEELNDDLPLVCLSPLLLEEEDLFEVALLEDVDALALEVKALLLEDDLEELLLPPVVDSLLLEVSLTLLPPTALGPPCFTAASVALATIFSAVSCSLKGLLPLIFEAALVLLAVAAALADEPLPAAVLVPLHAALLLPSRWSLLGTISNLPSGCREPPCLVLLIFILRPFSLSLADEFCEEAAKPLPRPLRSLEVRVVVSVNVCVVEPELLLLLFVVTSVLSFEEPEEAMPTGVPPPDEARLPPGDAGAASPFMEVIDVPVEAVEDAVTACPEAELADEVEVLAAGEAVDILSMSASKSMMRLPTSTSGQLLSSSKSKLSAAAEDDDDDEDDDEFEDCVELAALVWFAFLLAFLTDEEAGLLRLPEGVPGLEAAAAEGPLLLPAGVTLTGGCTSSCIGRDVGPQHHGAQRYTVEAGAHMKAFSHLLITCHEASKRLFCQLTARSVSAEVVMFRVVITRPFCFL